MLMLFMVITLLHYIVIDYNWTKIKADIYFDCQFWLFHNHFGENIQENIANLIISALYIIVMSATF